jgi:hypothetical protein
VEALGDSNCRRPSKRAPVTNPQENRLGKLRATFRAKPRGPISTCCSYCSCARSRPRVPRSSGFPVDQRARLMVPGCACPQGETAKPSRGSFQQHRCRACLSALRAVVWESRLLAAIPFIAERTPSRVRSNSQCGGLLSWNRFITIDPFLVQANRWWENIGGELPSDKASSHLRY